MRLVPPGRAGCVGFIVARDLPSSFEEAEAGGPRNRGSAAEAQQRQRVAACGGPLRRVAAFLLNSGGSRTRFQISGSRFLLARVVGRCRNPSFFESDGCFVHLDHSQASGNPVKVGDGCATVTGYKLPQPLVSQETGKAGARFQARSQDIGLAVLVMALEPAQAGRLFCFGGRLLRQREGWGQPGA
jgi:hypothetical protein